MEGRTGTGGGQRHGQGRAMDGTAGGGAEEAKSTAGGAGLRTADVAGTADVCAGQRAGGGVPVWRDGVAAWFCGASATGGIPRLRGDAANERRHLPDGAD